jgi:hypothetical protein
MPTSGVAATCSGEVPSSIRPAGRIRSQWAGESRTRRERSETCYVSGSQAVRSAGGTAASSEAEATAGQKIDRRVTGATSAIRKTMEVPHE